MKNKESIIFLVIISLFTATMTYASISWNSVIWGASKSLVTQEGKSVTMRALAPLSANAAKQMVGRAILGQAAALSFHPVVGVACLAIGTYYCVHDWTPLKDWITGNVPDLYTQTPYDTVSFQGGTNGSFYTATKAQDAPGYSGSYPSVVTITLNTSTSYTLVNTSYKTYQVPPPLKYLGISFKRPDGVTGDSPTNRTVGADCQIIITNQAWGSGIVSDNSSSTMNQTVLDNFIDGNPDVFMDPSKRTSTITTTKPTGTGANTPQEQAAIPGTVVETPYVDENGEAVDLETGQSLEPATQTSGGVVKDSFTAPPLPTVGIINTAITSPTVKSIPTLISDFMSNAPFVSIVKNFSVSAGTGSSTITLDMLGKSTTFDFADYTYLWGMISALLISLSYIYAAMIIFGGKR